jgi:alpha-D-glucose phosphate-specific phosphoglucomutase
MTNVIKFGTDGWRAIIAEDFTFANVRALAASVARYLKETGLGERGLVIGYDTRFGSDRFAEAVAEVVTAAGIKVLLGSDFAPTPAISYAIVHNGAGGAVVVTSSHNPASWNGIKYKPEYAGSASPEVVARLEAPLDEILAAGAPVSLSLADGRGRGLLESFDPRAPYLEGLAKQVDVQAIKSAGLRIAVDSMYGAGQGYLAELLSGGATAVTELHAEHNPNFPGLHAPEPISRNLGHLHELMREGVMVTDADPRTTAFDAGIATDGDADRLGVMDENGDFVNQLQVFALLSYYMLEVRGERGPIVRSITTTRMVDRMGEHYGVPVYETAVGFKFLGPKMMESDAILAGEESGGYAFRGHIPERDGILAGLCFLDLVARTGKRPTELLELVAERFGPHHYDRLDVELDAAAKARIQQAVQSADPQTVAGYKVTSRSDLDGYLYNLEGGGWLLIRFSGTEPLMRIYTEVPDKARVPEVLAAGRTLAGAEMRS